MKSGVIIRHLVLPGQLENTKAIIDYVSAHFPPHTVLFSLMSQYTPQPGAQRSARAAIEPRGVPRGGAVHGPTAASRTASVRSFPAQKRSIHRFLICRGSSMTDKRQFSCLRCGAGMRFIGRDKFQRRPDLFLSDLTFALAGGMEWPTSIPVLRAESSNCLRTGSAVGRARAEAMSRLRGGHRL